MSWKTARIVDGVGNSAAVVGTDIDGVLVPPAKEFEQVQFDLAVPCAEPRFPPIEQSPLKERAQSASEPRAIDVFA